MHRCCKSCATLWRLHRKILNSKSSILFRAASPPSCPWRCLYNPDLETASGRGGGAVRGWSGLKVSPQIYFIFIFHGVESSSLLDDLHGFPGHIIKLLGEIKSCFITRSYRSSIILFPSTSRSWLFTLTLPTSNLYSGLILAFQRHWFWPLSSGETGFCYVAKSCNWMWMLTQCGPGSADSVICEGRYLLEAAPEWHFVLVSKYLFYFLGWMTSVTDNRFKTNGWIILVICFFYYFTISDWHRCCRVLISLMATQFTEWLPVWQKLCCCMFHIQLNYRSFILKSCEIRPVQ